MHRHSEREASVTSCHDDEEGLVLDLEGKQLKQREGTRFSLSLGLSHWGRTPGREAGLSENAVYRSGLPSLRGGAASHPNPTSQNSHHGGAKRRLKQPPQ